MNVTNVVGFDLRIPKHFSLHFYDFSTILYEFSKFSVLSSWRFYAWPPRFLFSSQRGSLVGPGTEERQPALFQRGEALEVGARLGEMERISRRTCRWARWGLG